METLADVAFLGGAASALPAFGDRQVPGPDSEEGEGTVTVPGMFPSLALDLLDQALLMRVARASPHWQLGPPTTLAEI
jgi:hypothetical protein